MSPYYARLNNWVGYALHSPGTTLWNWPGVFMVQLARTFLSSDLANWNAESGRFHWIGSWDGLSSLYNHTTLGLPWFCLVLSTILWFAVPARRLIIIWMLATLIGALAVFSLIFASFIGIKGLAQAINYTDDVAAGRYLIPMLLAWFAVVLTMFFGNPYNPESIQDKHTTAPITLASVPSRADGKVIRKRGK